MGHPIYQPSFKYNQPLIPIRFQFLAGILYLAKIQFMKRAFLRLIAYSIDFFILAGVLLPLQFIILWASGLSSPLAFFDSGWEIYAWVFFSISLPCWIYFIAMERGKKAATLGKRLLGLQVQTKAALPISTAQAFGRTFIRLLPWEMVHLALGAVYLTDFEEIPMGILVADGLILVYLMVLFGTMGKSSVHDMVVRTQVIAVKDNL